MLTLIPLALLQCRLSLLRASQWICDSLTTRCCAAIIFLLCGWLGSFYAARLCVFLLAFDFFSKFGQVTHSFYAIPFLTIMFFSLVGLGWGVTLVCMIFILAKQAGEWAQKKIAVNAVLASALSERRMFDQDISQGKLTRPRSRL